MAGQTGNRATVTFSNNFTAKYRQIGGFREYHATIDDTGLTDSYEQTCAAALRRCDPIECEIFWDTDWSVIPNNLTPAGTAMYTYDAADGPPLGMNNQVITITYPPKGAQINGAKIQFTGVVTELTRPVLANETELTATMTIKPSTRAVYFAAS